MADYSSNSLYHPGYDPHAGRDKSDRVSTQKITIPMVIDSEEFYEREGQLPSVDGEKGKQKIFDVRDKELVLVKRGRGPITMRSDNTASISGDEEMKHVMPGFTSTTKIDLAGNLSAEDIYQAYACVGMSDGDDTLNAPHGFAGMIEGIKSYDYFGMKEVYEGTPMMWIVPKDQEWAKLIDTTALTKRHPSKDTAQLVPADMSSLHYDAANYRNLLNDTLNADNITFENVVENSTPTLSPALRGAIAEYYYQLNGAICANQALMLAGKGAFIPDLGAKTANALNNVRIAMEGDDEKAKQDAIVAYRNAITEVKKQTTEKKPQFAQGAPADFVAMMNHMSTATAFSSKGAADREVRNEFVSALFDGMEANASRLFATELVPDGKMKDSFKALCARSMSALKFGFQRRYEHLSALTSRIVGHAASHGASGDAIDVVIRNYRLESIFRI